MPTNLQEQTDWFLGTNLAVDDNLKFPYNARVLYLILLSQVTEDDPELGEIIQGKVAEAFLQDDAEIPPNLTTRLEGYVNSLIGNLSC